MFQRSGVRQQTKKGLRTELAISAEKDNIFCFLTEGPSLGEKKPKEERSGRKETRKVRVGTQHCWDNLISDQRRKGMELGEENEKVVTQQRHQQSGAAGSDRRTEFKLRNKDYVWLRQSGLRVLGVLVLGTYLGWWWI